MWTISRRLLCNRVYVRNLLNNCESISSCIGKPYIARGKQNDSNDENFKISRLFEPAPVQQSLDSHIGLELTGKIEKADILRAINKFSQKKENIELCKEHGMDGINDLLHH